MSPDALPVGAGPKEEAELHLFPDHGNWLVPLRLTLASAAKGTPAGVDAAEVQVTEKGKVAKTFTSLVDGHVYGTGPAGEVTVEPQEFPNLSPTPSGFVMRTGQEQESVEVQYKLRRARVTVRPSLKSGGPGSAIPGVTFELSLARPGDPPPPSHPRLASLRFQ